MVNSNVMTITSPEQQLKHIQSIDRNILSTTLITSREDVFETIDFLTKELNNPGANVEIVKTQLEIMRKIINTKINLTALVMGIDGNTHSIIPIIPTEVQQEITFDNNEDVKSPAKREGRVIQMNPSKEEIEEEKKVNFFKNYTRKVIFGTAIELPKEVQQLVTNATTESHVDEIARHLILSKRCEDALNLSIDLFSKIKLKTIEEVEKRFLFEVMPWCYGVTVEPLKDMQNITLSIWNEQLIKKAAKKGIYFYSSKKDPETLMISIKEGGTTIWNKNAVNVHPSELILATQKAVITPETKIPVGSNVTVKTVAEIEKETIEELNKGTATGEAAKKFFKNMKDVPEAKAEQGFAGRLWNKTLDTWKTLLQKKAEEEIIENVVAKKSIEVKEGKIIVDDKSTKEPTTTKVEEISAAAIVDKEYEKKEFEKIIKNVIIRGYKELGFNAKNEFDKIAKEKGAKKFLNGNLTNWFNSWKMEVLKEQPELVEIKQEAVIAKPLFKKLNIEEKNPDVWESAKLTKTIDEFDKLIGIITFEKKDLGWIIAANLVDQYLQHFESTKDFNEAAKHQWFKDCVNKHSEEREAIKKKEKEVAVIENKTTTISKQEVPVTEVEEKVVEKPIVAAEEEIKTTTVVTNPIKKPFDAKKYEAIATEGSKSKLNTLCGNFLLEISHGDLKSRKEELAKMLQQNSKYAKAKSFEISNYIAKLSKTNEAIEKLA